ncbi:predicted protein, partial [Nematostella vectensis]
IVLSLVITFANGVFFAAVFRHPSLRTPPNILVCSLGASDFLVGAVFLPLFTGFLLEHSLFKSCFYYGLTLSTALLTCGVSFATIVAISCERYLALFRPFTYLSLVTVPRVGCAIAISWILSSVIVATFVFSSASYASYVLLFLLACGIAVIAYTYCRIFKLARRHKTQIQAQQTIGPSINSQQKLAVTMAYVIGVTFMCYLPIACSTIASFIQGFDQTVSEAYYATMTLVTLSSVVNPGIYCWRNRDIRDEVVVLLRQMKIRQ